MAVELCTSNVEKELFLANFSNGILTSSDTLKKSKLYCHNNEKLRNKILVADTDRLQYAGYNFGSQSIRPPTDCKQYVGVLDKATNKMHIMSYSFFNMKPVLPDKSNEELAEEAEEIKPDVTKKSVKQRDMLTQSFGSLKKQRTMEMKHRLQVEVVDLSETMKTAVDNMTVADIEEDKPPIDDLKQLTNSLEDTLPPMNRAATAADKVYNIEDIASAEDLCHIEHLAQILSAGTAQEIAEWKTKKTYPQFVLEKLKTLPKAQSARLAKCKLLVYYSFLISIINVSNNNRRLTNKVLNPVLQAIPEQLRKKFVVTFFQTEGPEKGSRLKISLKMKDKLATYTLVLALLIDSLETMSQPLQHDLQIASKRFRLLVQVCGARLVTKKIDGNKTTFIRLVWPLAEINKTKGEKKSRRLFK